MSLGSDRSAATSGCAPRSARWPNAPRHWHSWAQDRCAAARARGHKHPGGLLTVGCWCLIVWRCWQDRAVYDPARHRGLQQHLAVTIPTPSEPSPDLAATQRMAGHGVITMAARRAERAKRLTAGRHPLSRSAVGTRRLLLPADELLVARWRHYDRYAGGSRVCRGFGQVNADYHFALASGRLVTAGLGDATSATAVVATSYADDVGTARAISAAMTRNNLIQPGLTPMTNGNQPFVATATRSESPIRTVTGLGHCKDSQHRST